jgi:hypothetical protein
VKASSLVVAFVSLLLIPAQSAHAVDSRSQAVACSEIGSWLQETPPLFPSARMRHMMAYDALNRRVVLFGGMTSLVPQSYTNETWTWNGNTWEQESPAAAPSPRDVAAMTYDEARGEIVLFGGANTSTVLGDTWTWDGTNWVQESPTTNPSGSLHSAMAFDALRGEVVMFGGFTNTSTGNATNETWTWDGTNWTLETPATSPSARGSHGMALDRIRGEVVLFGAGSHGPDLNDTWVWDGTDWIQKFPATSPPAGYGTNMVWSYAQEAVVLVGGIAGGGTESTQSWLWDGTDWVEECGGAPQSGGPTWSAVAYDATHAQIVLFGGRATDGLTPLDATQTWPHCDATPCVFVHGDVNCDGEISIIDVVKTISVSFRGADPATEYCNPCP